MVRVETIHAKDAVDRAGGGEARLLVRRVTMQYKRLDRPAIVQHGPSSIGGGTGRCEFKRSTDVDERFRWKASK